MSWLAGRGIGDITGEVAGCGMLGYGKSEQQTEGIHLRLRARAFVVDDGSSRVLLVVCELPLMFSNVFQGVLSRLHERHGNLYTQTNTLLTATHTHCGPGGYSQARLYHSNTGGFRRLTYDAIVDGITDAVQRAHDDLRPTDLSLSFDELHDASINRSRVAFDLNPEHDRAIFPDAIDPQVSVLRLMRDDRLAGALTWFATHGTSMTGHNRLVTSDNKGYASYHYERVAGSVDYLAPSEVDVVAAFAQTNAGDMSPNLMGAPGSGPTDDEFANTRIIGKRQYDASVGASMSEALTGSVASRVRWVDLSHVTVRSEFTGTGREERTSPPIVGAAALAGTDEGPGLSLFRQGRNRGWSSVSGLIYRLSARVREAQAPKDLAVPAGILNRLTPLVSETFPVQVMRLGQLYLIGIPGEVTIVAGLRLRRTVADIVGAELQHVLVTGYSNGYFHYVTTPEEYNAQRYEGASTFFGRWQLPALQQVVADLATALRDNAPVVGSSQPPQWLVPPGRSSRRCDALPTGRVIRAPRPRYRVGDSVNAVFDGAHPGHDSKRGSTFLEVERDDANGWHRVADDGDWETRLRWSPTDQHGVHVTVTWNIPDAATPGRHRIRYLGVHRDQLGVARPILGVTEPFEVVR